MAKRSVAAPLALASRGRTFAAPRHQGTTHSMSTTKNGKVALVTGANKGLGKEIAIQMARQGFTVLVAARDEAAGRGVAEAIVKEGGDAKAVKLEVTSADDIASVVSFI